MTDNILLLNHKTLREKSIQVDSYSLEFVIKDLLPKMVSIMRAKKGMGLAANQIDDTHAVFIMDIENALGAYINPEIIEFIGEEVIHEEGCLSIPGTTAKVKRFNKLILKYQDEKLQPQEVILEGLPAIVVQHEVDHLNGILYVDRLGETSKLIALQRHRKYLKLQSRLEKR